MSFGPVVSSTCLTCDNATKVERSFGFTASLANGLKEAVGAHLVVILRLTFWHYVFEKTRQNLNSNAVKVQYLPPKM